MQERAHLPEDGFAEDDEDPGVRHGVESRETERQEVLLVIAYRADGIDKAKNLRDRKRETKKRKVMLGERYLKWPNTEALLNFYMSRKL